jgi:hypothetical protein
MHPGLEANPDSDTTISWNTGEHRRKFLKYGGDYLDENRKQHHGDIMFWGEWEPESKVVKKLEAPLQEDKETPHYIYEPYYVPKFDKECRNLQNTDPYVFGNVFRYSLCQQPSHPSLRNLEEGSVILFGSSLDHKFALDTVFVVSGDVDYGPDDCNVLLQHVDETYKEVTIKPIMAGIKNPSGKSCAGKITNQKLRSYCGATFRNKINGMFSFFPCQVFTEDAAGFARPTIKMPSVISDRMTQGIKKTECGGLNSIRNYWEEVVKQVLETCSLGIFAETPKVRS